MLEIENLNFSVHSYNCLKKAGVHWVQDLMDYSEYDLLKIKNLGRKSFNEIILQLEKYKLSPEQFELSSPCSLDEVIEQGDQRTEQKAKQGNREAQYYLAQCFRDGTGVEVDLEKAFVWFEKAAERGYFQAAHNLKLCEGEEFCFDK